jgi:hypothetical protein
MIKDLKKTGEKPILSNDRLVEEDVAKSLSIPDWCAAFVGRDSSFSGALPPEESEA